MHRNSDPLETLWELQSTHLQMWFAFTRILPHHQLKSYGHMLGAYHVVNLAVNEWYLCVKFLYQPMVSGKFCMNGTDLMYCLLTQCILFGGGGDSS